MLATHIATAEETRQLEAALVATGVPWAELMERAGRGVADYLLERLGSARDQRILILVGPGNNGGDGLVVARHLFDAGAKVALYIWGRSERPDDQPWRECRARQIREIRAQADERSIMVRQAAGGADLIVDALLGIGVTRPLDGSLAQIVQTINQVRSARAATTPQVVAIDLPTGINADTGAVMGSAIMADATVATGVLKRGHVQGDGPRYAGEIVTVPIGLEFSHKEFTMAESLNTHTLRALVPARPSDSHKGTFGKVMVVAGAGRYPGAAFLAASGALRSGAGLVSVACGRSIFGSLAASLHETTFVPLPEEDWGVLGSSAAREVLKNLDGYQALVLGPGLGREDETKAFVSELLKLEPSASRKAVGFVPPVASPTHERARRAAGVGFHTTLATPAATPTDAQDDDKDPQDVELPPMVIDADGLYLLAQIEDWAGKVPAGRAVLTPHPGEMARLLNLEHAGAVNEDRVGAAQRAASEFGQIVVLKGAETVIATPDGQTRIGPAGNPALATAGTGDVLAGLIGGLLAQGMEPFDAACLGVFLHARAGELVRREMGDAGTVAGDLLLRLPRAIQGLRTEQ